MGRSSLIAAVLAAWLTNLGITKFNWNSILAVVIAVIAGTIFGAVISFLSIIISFPVVGIR